MIIIITGLNRTATTGCVQKIMFFNLLLFLIALFLINLFCFIPSLSIIMCLHLKSIILLHSLPISATIFVLLLVGLCSSDFSLMCNPGFRVTSIRRVNSAHQRKGAILGSFAIECQPIVPFGKAMPNVKCAALETTPQCNGWVEGCSADQWLGGFNAYVMDNATNAILLDPICCESPKVSVEQLSCASERLNLALMPFEHTIATDDFIYRGIYCWHQFDQSGAHVDLVWKIEICQLRLGGGDGIAPSAALSTSSSSAAAAASSHRSCSPCECHCGISVCGNGFEPVRVTHKVLSPKCVCNCACRYECV